MTLVPLLRMSNSCTLPPPSSVAELVLVIVVIPLVMEIVEVMEMSLITLIM